ncbi:MAG: DUF4864 domain-containing protein [Pseudomonadota bacterium]
MTTTRILLFALALTAGLALAFRWVGGQEPFPAAGLDPLEVVRIQLEALQHNDEPGPDAGIRTAFRFASPGNRATTGPIDRFIQMVRSEGYEPLVDHVEAIYGEAQATEDSAMVPVVIVTREGARYAYLWVLSRQSDGEFAGCWMTDSVLPHPTPRREEPVGRLI